MKLPKLIYNTLRIKQWIKNSFLFIPAFFAGTLFSIDEITKLTQAFFAFSLITSAIYIINDIRDREMDRLHPKKKNRPFAANKISPQTGYIMMVVLLSLGSYIAYGLSLDFLYMCLLYVVINISYSMGLKTVPIIDLLIVSFGFIIRIYMGGIISGVPVSHWLSIMIFLLSLFIVLAKRSDDIRIFEEEGKMVRKTSSHYNRVFINSCITMVSGIIIVSYIMYTLSPEITQQWDSEYIFTTTIFVIAGIMRYLQMTMVEGSTGSPVEIIYSDKFIIITLVAWLVSFGSIIYF
ncbi:MAG: UbiA prenyltransferase family protein [Reichenbachiella sp.]